MNYRNRTDITVQVLEAAASGPVTKQVITYNAFLSSTQLKEYLNALMENGLIECLSTENKYRATEKGLKLLKMMEELLRFIEPKSNQIQS
jgi:predicted transcriptional regulator